jgi:hypothetical protein
MSVPVPVYWRDRVDVDRLMGVLVVLDTDEARARSLAGVAVQPGELGGE